jgi:hypothetical protein
MDDLELNLKDCAFLRSRAYNERERNDLHETDGSWARLLAGYVGQLLEAGR